MLRIAASNVVYKQMYLYAFIIRTTLQQYKYSSIISAKLHILSKKLAWACELKLVQKYLTSLFAYSITQLVWEVKNHAYLDANKGTVVRSQPSVRCAHKDNEKGTQRIHLVSGPWVEHSCGLRAKNKRRHFAYFQCVPYSNVRCVARCLIFSFFELVYL